MFDIRKLQEQIIFDAVKNHSDSDTAKEIVYGIHPSAVCEDNAHWVKSTMARLENKFDQEQVKQIRMNCQCGYKMDEKLALVKGLMSTASNLEEFANSDQARAAGLYCEDGTLYLQFTDCPCPMVADVDKFETNTWCQCTTGYSQVLFEKAFGCKVDVELLKSIKMGDDRCLMKILPYGPIWE
ncbi:MAG TPA: hypothetical protein DIT32_02730 [Peptococcaceae bacterium]|nr:hypothetical protein [Peptococcaceae bacterium]